MKNKFRVEKQLLKSINNSITRFERILASTTTSSLNTNVPSTHGSSRYVKNIKTSRSFIKVSLSWNWTQNTYHLSHSFFTRITNLLTGHSRYERAISVVPDVSSMIHFYQHSLQRSLPLAKYFVLLLLPWVEQYLLLCDFSEWCSVFSNTEVLQRLATSSNINILSPSTPELIRDVLHSSSMFTTINIWCSKTSK